MYFNTSFCISILTAFGDQSPERFSLNVYHPLESDLRHGQSPHTAYLDTEFVVTD
uniref:Uncharacterized protein n=1 Tax=Rhizophora mucronata TaxID=61149 RepID=A0A2P2NAK9_RHIMU